MTDHSTQTSSADTEEQRAVLRSFCLAGKTASEAYDHICEAYGDEAMHASDSLDLFNQFVSDKKKSRDAIQFCREFHVVS